jgi:hypothetical protein
MAILSEALGKTDDEIKVTLRKNIVLIGEQIKEIKNSMIKHKELKNKLAEAEKKLQKMYQLEIKEEIKTLKDDSTELFTTFPKKFDDSKAQLEQAASQRSDAQDIEINTLKASLNDMKNLLQTEITKLDGDVEKSVTIMKSKIETLEKVQNKRADDLGKIILALNRRFLILLITKYIMFLYSIFGMTLL